jgi:rRNA-processing protein FCF1
MSVVIFLDGVMRKHKDMSLIIEGSALYKTLNETNRVIIVAEDREKADIWLKTNNLAKKIDDIFEHIDTVSDNIRLATIESLRSRGKIDYVVTEDIDLARSLIEVGIPVLVFLNPRYTRPEFRPDAREGVKSWELITDELDRQQGLYVDDKRVTDPEEIAEELE